MAERVRPDQNATCSETAKQWNSLHSSAALIPEVTAEGQVAPLADKDGHHFPIKFMDGDKLPPGGPAWLQQVRRYLGPGVASARRGLAPRF